jgi:hypothetical protein
MSLLDILPIVGNVDSIFEATPQKSGKNSAGNERGTLGNGETVKLVDSERHERAILVCSDRGKDGDVLSRSFTLGGLGDGDLDVKPHRSPW